MEEKYQAKAAKLCGGEVKAGMAYFTRG